VRANLIPTIIVAVLFFGTFRRCYLRFSAVAARAALVVFALIAATPAVLFASNYLLCIPCGTWFFLFHALPGAEITAGCVTGVLGIMFAYAKLRPARLNAPVLSVASLVAFGLVLVPFAKQLLFGLDYGSLADRTQDGVCLQTSKFTCVPASATTLMRVQGWQASEKDLAREAGTTSRGTEIWYLMRALRKRGYEVQFRQVRTIEAAPVPSIIGVHVGDVGHVVVLLDKDRTGATVGEPLCGRHHYTWPVLMRHYRPDGNCITIRRISGRG
jgi:hypothetical protein